MTARGFDLVEAMRFDPVDGIALLDGHLARLTASADALGFAFDRHGARNALHAATFRLNEDACVRLLLAPGGATAIEIRVPPPPAPELPVRVALARLPDGAADARLGHRTTANQAGAALLYVSDAGLIAPGGVTPFLADGDMLLTPPVPPGHAAGVLRAELIATGRAREARLRVADLARGFVIGGATLGLLPAILA